MSLDFFLQNRAHQIARLCAGESRKVDLVGNQRGKQPQVLAEFCQLVDRICEIGRSDDTDLTDSQRNDLQQFERSIVRLRFSSDEAVKQPAVKLIKAVFADADYFSGLKPLPQYTDTFAYELLFPSWLNLLTATMLPRSGSGKPRVEGRRQGVLFEFLGKVSASGVPCENRLVGLLTFVARRFDAPLCEELLHRFVELYTQEGCELVERLESIESSCRNARQYALRVRDYLTVRHSMNKWPPNSQYPIAYQRPALRVLPGGVSRILKRLDESQQDWESFFQIAEPLRLLINSDHLLTAEFTQVMEVQPELAANLLRLVIQGSQDQPEFLSAEGQSCLATMIQCESEAGAGLDRDRLSAFTAAMAPRLTGFSDATLHCFRRQFVQDAANRARLLEACVSEVERQQLTNDVLHLAAKTDDEGRFLELLGCATVISPSEDAAAAKNSLQAIDAVVQNRSIGNKEFRDLVEDLHANVDVALTYLSNPIMAAGGKTPRLAALYMTLSEVSHTFAETGRGQNFSVVRAKYSALTNLDGD